MLTVDFDRLGLRPGDRVLDLGCGAGRHAFEMYRRGADVDRLRPGRRRAGRGARPVRARCARPARCPRGAEADVKEGDALSLPFADGEFDRVVAAEVLEHIPADIQARSPSSSGCCGPAARSRSRCRAGCPRWSAGRCPTTTTTSRAATSGSTPTTSWSRKLSRRRPGRTTARDHAHGLHSPYWWIKCAVGVDQRRAPAREGLPPAAGLGHHEAAAGADPAAPSGCSTR